MKTENVYAMIKTGWLLALIPVMLGTGPLAGYIIGDLLVRKLHCPNVTIIVFVTLGFAAGIQETVKILRIALKTKR